MSGAVNQTVPITRRVRAYFAPVNRTTGTPTVFDSAQDGRFALDAPPSPWIDLGWCEGFHRRGENGSANGISVLRTGTPALATGQVRTELEAIVEIEFISWGKLQMALTCGSQQMNLLRQTKPAHRRLGQCRRPDHRGRIMREVKRRAAETVCLLVRRCCRRNFAWLPPRQYRWRET